VQARSGPARESRGDWSTARNAEFQALVALDGCDCSRRAVDGKAAAAGRMAIGREGEKKKKARG
jgi:hypothetical protein